METDNGIKDRARESGDSDVNPAPPTLAGFSSEYDVVVVGARCAGAATAMLLARSGLRVLAVDRGVAGADTLSTHALMRAGVLQLARWGLADRLRATRTPAIRSTVFHYGDVPVEIEVKPRDGVDALYAPRRTVLDPLLVDAAIEAGAEFRYGQRVVALVRAGAGRVAGVVVEDAAGARRAVRAGLVVGADGMRSTIARLAGAATTRRGRHAAANLYAYWTGLPVDGSHWHFGPGVTAGALPTNGGAACVFAGMPPRRFRDEIRHDLAAGYRRVVREAAPALARALERATLASPLHGFPGEPGFFREAWGPGWALVGDASYFKDPATAHGISDALRDAELLARAVVEGTAGALARYAQARDELSVPLFETTDEIASFDWDAARLQQLHKTLSREMNREAAALAALAAWPAVRRTSAAPTAAPSPA